MCQTTSVSSVDSGLLDRGPGPRRRADGVSFPATRSPWRNLQSADDSIPIAAHGAVADTLESLKDYSAAGGFSVR